MELQFDANQEFQLEAVDAVADLFEGQPRVDFSLQFSPSTGGALAVANQLDLTDTALLDNLSQVQARNGLAADSELAYIEKIIATDAGETTWRFLNYSVEMETATGKTYVYLRTLHELYRRYGLKKFVIVVPSVAIREGVLKTLQLTANHFRELYGNPPYRFFTYRADNLALLRQFALSSGIEVMVITIDSFNKPTNVLRQSDQDRLQGETPLHLLQATHPIIVLDEPQNMETKLRVDALASLAPLAALRFSATHRQAYNAVYRLTPYDAYRQGLVKRIEVAGIEAEDNLAQPYVRLRSIAATKRTVSARLEIHKLMKTGAVKEVAVKVKPGDRLVDKAGRTEYEDYDIEEINPGGNFIRFSNHRELGIGDAVGIDRDTLFDVQIRYTIEEHFRKQARLRAHGVKVLSLFFIDRVANYVGADGLIRVRFEHHFNELKGLYDEWRDTDVSAVHTGYFASKRRRDGETRYLDSSGTTEADQDAYDLIMRDKERLLEFDEPRSFIFSHSALREGWDSPNVFQICTLNETGSAVRKRQEVGRGIRLPVAQTGERVRDLASDALTVVANESYDQFVAGLQQEIDEDYGPGARPPKPGNARQRGTAQLKKRRVLAPEFRELWERIKQRTLYAVKIDSDALVGDLVPRLDELHIAPPRVSITKAVVTVGDDDELDALQLSAAKTVQGLAGRYALPNLIDIMSHLMEHTSPPMYLTRQTLMKLFTGVKGKKAAMENPHEFATRAVQVIKQHLADHLVAGIKYERIDSWYEMTQLEPSIESWEQYLVKSKHSIYDHIVCDSDTERRFVEGLEKRQDIKVYVKLPSWFKVATPVGDYNPDWALVREERDAHGELTGEPCLYLVRETKSTHLLDKLRPDERRKVICGQRHFQDALDVDYKVVTQPSEV